MGEKGSSPTRWSSASLYVGGHGGCAEAQEGKMFPSHPANQPGGPEVLLGEPMGMRI